MRSLRLSGAAFALALAFAAFGFTHGGQAPYALLRSGIGLQSCEKLAPDIKPSEGFNHLPNALLFYWVQGYLSAANVYLLNEYTDFVDLNAVGETKITQLVAD